MPLCIHCHLKPVGRLYGVAVPGKRGLRLIDGARWKWFCSTACSAIDRVSRMPAADMLAVSQRRTARLEQRIADRLRAACTPVLDDRGRVDPTDLVAAVMVELRRQYQRQFHAKRRAEVKEAA